MESPTLPFFHPFRAFARSAQIAILALFLAGFVGCAHQDPEDFARDDYFGGHGNMTSPTHYVPAEAQRVEPWWAIF